MTSTKFELGDTGTKYQFKYYTVRINMTSLATPSATLATLHTMLNTNNAIEQWVISTFGPELGWTEADRIWWSSEKRYYFLHESDRTLFLLRWE